MVFHGQAQFLATIVNQVEILLENYKKKKIAFSTFLGCHDTKKNFMDELLTESYFLHNFLPFLAYTTKTSFFFWDWDLLSSTVEIKSEKPCFIKIYGW